MIGNGLRAAGWAAVLALCACVAQRGPSNDLVLRPVATDRLPGWTMEHPAALLPAFWAECRRLALLPPDTPLGGTGLAAELGGQAGDWGNACAGGREVARGDDAAARRFFAAYFQAYRVAAVPALFTGYYEPEIRGSRVRGGAYQVPLLARPRDLVQRPAADQNAPAEIGRLQDGRLVPYWTRREIEQGALDDQQLEIVWLTSPVDLFFLQIQGAGRIRLPDGDVLRVAYAGKNGRTYVPIGRLLVERHALAPDQVSMQAIRGWLEAHPDQAAALMDANQNYVFFRVVSGAAEDDGPPGALAVDLAPGRSAAIDRHFIPLGAALWIDTTDAVTGQPLRRLVLAQDLGTDIVGPGRVDIFCGWGPLAEAEAGRLHASGKLYLLLPRPTATAGR